MDDVLQENSYSLFSKSILSTQDIYINGTLVAKGILRDKPQSFSLDKNILRKGKNEVYFVGKKIKKSNSWDEPNTDPGVIGVEVPAKNYSRSLFSGKALVVIKTKPENGVITLKATSDGLSSASISIK